MDRKQVSSGVVSCPPKILEVTVSCTDHFCYKLLPPAPKTTLENEFRTFTLFSFFLKNSGTRKVVVTKSHT